VFLGGCIVPGVDLMQHALAGRTAQLARRAGEFRFFPDNTADAIVSGALNAIAGAVDRMAAYMREAGEPEPLVVLSGGAAPLVAPRLEARVALVENLVLEGLQRIAAGGGEP
jgi:type III pantothenate kinase